MKNGCVAIGNTDMYYVSFGTGERKLVVLPGLSDGLATVKGKAMLLAAPYRRFFRDHTALMVDTAEKMYSEKYLQKKRKIFPLLPD